MGLGGGNNGKTSKNSKQQQREWGGGKGQFKELPRIIFVSFLALFAGVRHLQLLLPHCAAHSRLKKKKKTEMVGGEKGALRV